MNISFLKFQLILKEVVFIMKEQLNQLSAYQPGLSPRALKEESMALKEIYINLHQMKICMDHRLKLKKRYQHT